MHGFDYGDSDDLTHTPPVTVTGSNGEVTVPHNLGGTPTAVQVTSRDRNVFCYVFSKGSTQFVVRCAVANTNVFLPAGTGVQFDWTAWL